MLRQRPKLRIASCLASGSLVLSALAVPAATSAAPASGGVAPLAIVGPVIHAAPTSPPTSADCIGAYGIACYAPTDMQNQYNLGPLYAKLDTGTGQTIVIFDAFGSPTIAKDLTAFDQAFGLPDPPSFKVYMPEGKVTYSYTGVPSPANFHNKNLGTAVSWAYETTLDVEWAHAIAPGANIALVVTPIPETQGVQGLTNLQNAQQWALANHIGTIWSNSWATTEQAFQTPASIQVLNRFYARAAAQGVSAFFATGDSGVANGDKQGRLFPYPTVNFPSSSPNVISVGGTQITTPVASINSYQPEAVWNDGYGAGGGGYSAVFPEPSFQSGAAISDPPGMRGLPDVSYNAAIVSAILIYESFDPAGAGWAIIGGTSAATPQWAAIDAVANQADGALGFLAPRLYQIAENSTLYAEAFNDITAGDNSFGGITGYSAGTGWDAASGLGTPNAAGLVDALTHTTP